MCRVCVCVSVFLHDNSKSNRSMNMKLEDIVMYENIPGEFDIRYWALPDEVTA